MEERIYQEAELIYKKLPNFKPNNGNLKSWNGKIKLKNKKYINLLITIPDNFPNQPPKIMTKENISHKFVKDKLITIPLLMNWNKNLHIYQAINSIIVNFNKNLPKIKKYDAIPKKKNENNSITDQKNDEKSFFDTELEKLALNELMDALKSLKRNKKIDEKTFKRIFTKYLTEIKKINKVEKLII
ncbi:MAG: hypothetical protein ACTSX4_07215 [Candidatus Helarchaeota archaeon]